MYIILSRLEYIRCVFRRQIPFVKSSRYLRRAVADEINKHFRDATSVVDIGAGYGRLANYIARHCDVSVVALENMPFTITIARIVKFFTRSPIQIIQCDAFEYLKTSPHFNIGVAYLGPNVNSSIANHSLDNITKNENLDDDVENIYLLYSHYLTQFKERVVALNSTLPQSLINDCNTLLTTITTANNNLDEYKKLAKETQKALNKLMDGDF